MSRAVLAVARGNTKSPSVITVDDGSALDVHAARRGGCLAVTAARFADDGGFLNRFSVERTEVHDANCSNLPAWTNWSMLSSEIAR